jgi:hypothetical protein
MHYLPVSRGNAEHYATPDLPTNAVSAHTSSKHGKERLARVF